MAIGNAYIVSFLKHVLILLSFLMVVLTNAETRDRYCHATGTTANYSYQNLTFIPQLQGNIECLIFEGNNLPNVTQGTFKNISQPKKLYSLHLGFNKIVSITANAFRLFDKLRYLDISGNHIQPDDMKYLLGNISRNDNLRTLKLNDIGEQAIQDNAFSLMEGTRLEELYLKSNNITYLSPVFLKIFKLLKELVLTSNLVKNVDFVNLNHLYKVDLNNNRMNTIPNFCMNDNKSSLLPHLSKLYLNYNQILDISKDSLRCLEHLSELEIRGNFISVLPDDMLLYVPRLWSLNAEKNTGHNSRIEPYAFRSESLRVLKIGWNGAGTTGFSSVTETFKYVPNLFALELSYVNMMDMPEDSIHTLFSPLIHVKYIKCYSCGIQFDPKTILDKKAYLNKINLDKNYIEHLSNASFKSMPKLKNLFLNMNKIGHLKESDISVGFLNSLDHFDLSRNPFICDCDLDWFITWLRAAKKTTVKYYPEEYVCAYPANLAGKKLAKVHFTYRECHPYTAWEWACFVGGPIVVVIVLIALVLYRKRWTIKHYIYLMRKRKNYIRVDGDNFLYDAFVAYNQDDSMWVKEHLIPFLEEEHRLNLCIHERDFQAGVFINDNIINCIEKSKKIIVILSNTFSRSGWCMFELRVAHSKHIEDETELLVILLEKINGRNMNESMKTLLETTTYIEWTEDNVGQTLFWNRLKGAMNK